jgi:hypothetical protein
VSDRAEVLADQVGELRVALNQWRTWAQFVWLGGGPVVGTDEELQASICAQFDALELAKSEWKALAAIGTWHKDCRPNRHQAAQELLKSQAVINKLADRIAELEAAQSDPARVQSVEEHPSIGSATETSSSLIRTVLPERITEQTKTDELSRIGNADVDPPLPYRREGRG